MTHIEERETWQPSLSGGYIPTLIDMYLTYCQRRDTRTKIYDISGGFQNPYNHNPYCVGILIGSAGIFIWSVGIIIVGILNCRDYNCRDFDTNPIYRVHFTEYAEKGTNF